MKRIYISIPITGKENDVFERAEVAKACVTGLGYEPVCPLDLNGQTFDNIGQHGEIHHVAEYMGNDIRSVILADGIYMCRGWENSKGCQVEWLCAKLYGKKILYEGAVTQLLPYENSLYKKN